MKNFMSRKHAEQLKRFYMKTGMAREKMMRRDDLKAAMYDMMAEFQRQPRQHDEHRTSSSRSYCNS